MIKIKEKILSQDVSFYIDTLGCAKNQVDSRRMRNALLKAGYREATTQKEANFYLINSCSFIKEAQEETISTIFEAIQNRKKNTSSISSPIFGEQKIGIIGCFPERFSRSIKKKIPEIDFQIGTGKYQLIPYLLSDSFNIHIETHDAQKWLYHNSYSTYTPYSYFRIATGCSRKCSFCIIPSIRGKLSKSTLNEIKQEFQTQQALYGNQSIKEVILISQDTITQGVDELEEIIYFFSEQPEVKWIRLHYIFPDKKVLNLLDLFPKYPKLTSYLDIPFQHLSPKVLKDMNRPSNVDLFKDILQKAYSVRPNIEIRSSIIIGYPTETDNDIKYIEKFLEKNLIHKLALFRYSHEINTPVYKKLNDNISHDIKIETINSIRNLHLAIRTPYRSSLLDRKEQVLIDAIHNHNDYYEVVARRAQDSPDIDEVIFINVDKNELPINKTTTSFSSIIRNGEEVKIGDFKTVCITDVMEYDYIGEF